MNAVNFPMARCYGWLVHLPTLPSRYGIGDFAAGVTLLSRLADAEARLWQLLPIHPPGYGHSPYSAFSAFALDPLLISPQWLWEDGFLAKAPEEEIPVPRFAPNQLEYSKIQQWKLPLLRRAYHYWRMHQQERESFEQFCTEQHFWLKDYTLFCVLKSHYHHRSWTQWDPEAQNPSSSYCQRLRQKEAEALQFHAFLQWIAHRQLQKLRSLAHQRGIALIGDLPIFVAYDSADVWAHPHLFKLDRNKRPIVVAGVPPDYFSPTGQRWGNPVYHWRNHRAEHFLWWTQRIRHLLQWFDFIRIDHFRGFAAIWEIPADAPDATTGRWTRAAGSALFRHLRQQLPHLPILAEDLGTITDDVIKLRERFGFPGMKVLQFGLESSDPAHPFLPHNFPSPHTVLYTATHDNDTSLGWFLQLTPRTQAFIYQLSGHREATRVVDWMIQYALFSTANFVIFPLQDILLLDSHARLNTPGTVTGNWTFRFSSLPDSHRCHFLAQQSELANRLHSPIWNSRIEAGD